ncbi:hypothetical protein D920_00804 [Enterococcus faecalis 13-SD-W-01]|nr:hypothetical protein D920_00804 [Enterococcus faecalis 13-SD-W-01]
MKKLDVRYIIGAFMVMFILRGIIYFVLEGRHSFTLSSIFYEYPLGLIVMNELPIGKGWKKFRYWIVTFMSFYLPLKVVDFFGTEKITLTIGSYLIVLAILFAAQSAAIFYRKNDIKITHTSE